MKKWFIQKESSKTQNLGEKIMLNYCPQTRLRCSSDNPGIYFNFFEPLIKSSLKINKEVRRRSCDGPMFGTQSQKQTRLNGFFERTMQLLKSGTNRRQKRKTQVLQKQTTILHQNKGPATNNNSHKKLNVEFILQNSIKKFSHIDLASSFAHNHDGTSDSTKTEFLSSTHHDNQFHFQFQDSHIADQNQLTKAPGSASQNLSETKEIYNRSQANSISRHGIQALDDLLNFPMENSFYINDNEDDEAEVGEAEGLNFKPQNISQKFKKIKPQLESREFFKSMLQQKEIFQKIQKQWTPLFERQNTPFSIENSTKSNSFISNQKSQLYNKSSHELFVKKKLAQLDESAQFQNFQGFKKASEQNSKINLIPQSSVSFHFSSLFTPNKMRQIQQSQSLDDSLQFQQVLNTLPSPFQPPNKKAIFMPKQKELINQPCEKQTFKCLRVIKQQCLSEIINNKYKPYIEDRNVKKI